MHQQNSVNSKILRKYTEVWLVRAFTMPFTAHMRKAYITFVLPVLLPVLGVLNHVAYIMTIIGILCCGTLDGIFVPQWRQSFTGFRVFHLSHAHKLSFPCQPLSCTVCYKKDCVYGLVSSDTLLLLFCVLRSDIIWIE